ncbi:2-dehydropantoate 2-reductase [Neptunicella sp. SCSIO 80796]|uniref:2-dehydropantoate 2-reductase n=1 Tax=Neptunicella plasticusilytica TaxID=3117012 RepID=UPI003A4DBF07
MVQHIVFGAGLIGSYLGAIMQLQGLSVTLIGRQNMLDKLKDGITLTDYHQHRQQVRMTGLYDIYRSPNAILPTADFLWLTVKCTGIQHALIDIQLLVTPQTVILCCQNGLGSDQQVKQAFPNNAVLRVMVPFNVVQFENGHFHRGSEGALTIEHDESTIANELQALLACELLPVRCDSDMHNLLWAKLQLNLGNAVNAIADIPVKAMLRQRNFRRVIATMMEELLAVVRAQDIKLPRITAVSADKLPMILRLPDWLFVLVANKMLAIDPDVRTSMWWDLHQHKQTEIDYLNGEIVKWGVKLAIPTPVNSAVVQWIKAIESEDMVQGVSGQDMLVRLNIG